MILDELLDAWNILTERFPNNAQREVMEYMNGSLRVIAGPVQEDALVGAGSHNDCRIRNVDKDANAHF